jgi:hypothetical protein
MVYRFDEDKKVCDELEQLAAEEEEAELEQIAQDLIFCSKAEEAEVRLRTRGIILTKKESREEAKEYVSKLLQRIRDGAESKKERRKQIFAKIKKVRDYVAKTITAVVIIGLPVYATVHYWNTRDEALEALEKYDKSVTITDPNEREEVISHLDEIFEEHSLDIGSDSMAEEYFSYLENRGITINEGARILDKIGESISVHNTHPSTLINSVDKYHLFLEMNEISSDVGECLLESIDARATNLISDLYTGHKNGTCNNK